MNSEIYFGGRKYISVRKASELTGYTRDYIGQLCRQNKIESTRIDRSWYVEASSILDYAGKELDQTDLYNKELEIKESRLTENISSSKTNDFSAHSEEHFTLFHLAKTFIFLIFVCGMTVGLLTTAPSEVKKLSQAISTLPNNLYSVLQETTDWHAKGLGEFYIKMGGILLTEFETLKQSPGFYTSQKLAHLGEVEEKIIDERLKKTIDFFENSKKKSLAYVTYALGDLNMEFSNDQEYRQNAFLALALEPFENSSLLVYKKINSLIENKLYSHLSSFFNERDTNASPALALEVSQKNKATIAQAVAPKNVPSSTISPSNKIIEKIIERVVSSDVTKAYVDLSLQQLNNKLTSEFSKLSVGSGGAVTNIYQQIANTQKIDNLYNTAISNPVITGGRISNMVVSATSLSAETSSLTTLSTTNLTVSGAGMNVLLSTNAGGLVTGTSTPTFNNFNAVSLLATSTLATGGLTVGDNQFVIQQNSGKVGIGTTSPNALIEILQTNNGWPILSVYRNNDIAPAGDFINYKTKSGTTLFRVDNSGNLLAGGIVNSGSQTITSISSPQLRVQYDPSNELTFGSNASGSTTISASGTNSAINFATQNDLANAFNFQNSSGVSVLNIDTLNGRVGVGTTSPGQKLSVAGDILGNKIIGSSFTATSTTATTTLAGGILGPGNFTVQQVTGRVGIGTTTPNRALDVVGVGAFYYPTDVSSYFRLGADSVGSYFEGDPSGRPISFYIGGSEKVRYTTTGVGIGSTTPNQKLVVDGNATFDNTTTGATQVRASHVGSAVNAGFLADDGLGTEIFSLTRQSSNTLSLSSFGNIGLVGGATGGPSSNYQLYLQGSSGYLGLGTTTPANKLSVIGNIVSDNTNGGVFSVYTNAGQIGGLSTELNVTGAGSASNLMIFADGSATSGNILFRTGAVNRMIIDKTTGNVGIGTSTPQATLNIVGAVGRDVDTGAGELRMKNLGGSTSEYGLTIGVRGVSNNGLGIYDYTNLLYRMYINSSGNIGIGTTTQGSKLSVSGGVSIGANYGASAPTNGLIVEGSVGIGTNSPSNKFEVHGGAIKFGSGGFSGGTAGDLTISRESSPTSGVIYFGNSNTSYIWYTGSGYTFTGGGLGINAGRTIGSANNEIWSFGARYNTGTGTFYFGATNSATPDGVFSNTSGAEQMRITNGGNLGIGTTSPGQRLSVNGDILGYNIVGSSYTATSTTATSTFLGKVGIGTTNPNSTLHLVTGVGALGTTNFLNESRVFTISNPDLAVQKFSLTNSTSGTGAMYIMAAADSSNDLNLRFGIQKATDPTFIESMRIASTARLIIGTSNIGQHVLSARGGVSIGNTYTNIAPPTNGLIIEGNMGLGASSPPAARLTLGDNVASGFLDNFSEYQMVLYGGTGSASSAYGMGVKANTMVFNSNSSYSFDRGGNATSMVIDGSGNVGIGTTTPAGKLDVQQTYNGAFSATDSATFNTLRLANPSNVANAGPGILFAGGNGASADLAYIATSRSGDTVAELVFGNRVGSALGERMRIDESGNLGLGTPNPVARLSVESSESGNYVATLKQTHSSPYGLWINYTNAAPNGSSNQFIYASDNAALRFEVRSSGGIANYSANNVNLSDERMKNVFGNAPSELERFSQLNFVLAEYKDNPLETKDVMLLAQQVQTIYPELVTTFDETEGTLGIRDGALALRAYKALQDLNLKVESLASSTPMAESLGERAITNIITKTKEWLASAANGITEMIAGTFRAKDQLCINNTCVTEAQLQALLLGATSAGASGGNGTSTPAVDTSAPAIIINGNNPATITVGTSYVDLGATVSDTNENGEVNNNLNLYYNVNGTDMAQVTIDTTATSTHTIIYSAVDGAGNWGYATRTVEVIE